MRTAITCILLFLATHAAAATLEAALSFDQSPRVALVWFADDTGNPPAEVVVDQIDKAFTVPLAVGAPGGTVVFRNSDRLEHNVYADEPALATSFDAGLAAPGVATTRQITWKDGEVVRCGCKIHPRMQVYIASLASRYHRIALFPDKTPAGQPATAAATIADVPAGLRRVRVWLPKLGTQEAEVEPGKPAQLTFRRNDQIAGTVTLRME